MTKNEIIQKINESLKNGKKVSIYGGSHPSDGSRYYPVNSVDDEYIYSLNRVMYSPTETPQDGGSYRYNQYGYVYIDGEEYYLNLH